MQISYYPSQSKPKRQGTMRMDLDERQFATQAKEKRVAEAIAYAKTAARQCARTMVIHNVVLDELDIQSRMAGYQVNRHLREYATKLTFEYVKQLREKR